MLLQSGIWENMVSSQQPTGRPWVSCLYYLFDLQNIDLSMRDGKISIRGWTWVMTFPCTSWLTVDKSPTSVLFSCFTTVMVIRSGGAQICGKILFLGVSVRAFLLKLAFELVELVKQFTLPSIGGYHPICWGPDQNKKLEEGRIQPFLPSCLR